MLGAVVAAEDDERVFGELQLIEQREQTTDLLVRARDGAVVGALRLGGVGILFFVLVRGGDEVMCLVNPEIEVERLVVVFADETHRVIGGGDGLEGGTDGIVRAAGLAIDAAAFEDAFARTRPHRRIIVAVFRRQRRFDARSLPAQVPLAKVRRGVTGFLEHARQQRCFRIEPVRHAACHILCMAGEVLMHAMPRRILAGNDRGAAGRAHGIAHGELMEVGALACEAVEIRCLQMRMPVAGEIAKAPVIGVDEEDVRLRRTGRMQNEE